MSAVAFDGTIVVLKPQRWRHIILRHPELKNAETQILEVVAHPNEVYVDPTGAFHALKRVHNISDYLVIIYSVEPEGYIRTAHYTSNTRKTRRYRAFRKLKLS